MSKFPHAWCPERQTLLEPADVRDFCATTGRIPELLCPDEDCRREMPQTRITAVCCDPRKECGSPWHFRNHIDHRHGEGCQYETLNKHTDYVLKHTDEFIAEFPNANLLRKISGIDSTMLYDAYVTEFTPREFMDAVRERTREYTAKGFGRDKAIRLARCAVPQKTAHLALVVDVAQKLSDAGHGTREQVPLALPGRSTIANYNNAFLMIASLKHDYTTPYIFCGEGRVSEVSGGYLIEYEHKLKNYHPDFPDLPACTPINADMYKAAFLEELSGYAASGELCAVYSFSAHALKENTCPMSDKKQCVVIEPRVRDSVVIRNLCLKREQNKTR